ncbi:hypothetical protein DFH28DRAFT_1135881 [Melampsora americana]|nr:hypothetical protein DFH28DRAFT_1135881 [Melampsora americana]
MEDCRPSSSALNTFDLSNTDDVINFDYQIPMNHDNGNNSPSDITDSEMELDDPHNYEQSIASGPRPDYVVTAVTAHVQLESSGYLVFQLERAMSMLCGKETYLEPAYVGLFE